MLMDIEQIRKKFPSPFPKDFPISLLPDGAELQEIGVFRVCRSGKISENDFLPTYRERGLRDKEINSIGSYSMSVYEDPKDARKRKKFFERRGDGGPVLAKGVTSASCGPCQRTKERETTCHDSHIDWWLYKDAKPHKWFALYEE